MKKFLDVLYKILAVVILITTFVGFYMMISYMGRNNTMTLIFMGVFLAGCLGFALMVVLSVRKKHKSEDIENK